MGATSVILLDTGRGNEPSFDFDVSNGRDILAHYLNGTEVFALMSDGFIRTTSGWATRHASVGIGDVAGDNDAYTYPLFRARNDITIVTCSIGVDTTAAANASNYQTIYLEQTGSTTDLGTLTTASTGFTAKVPRDFTITAAAASLKAGDTLSLRFAKTGSGVALSGVVVSFTYTIDQPTATVGETTDNIIRIMDDIGTAAVIKTTNVDAKDHLVVKERGVETFRIDLNGKMTGNSPDQYYYQVCNVGTIAAADSATKNSVIFKPHCDVDIYKVYLGTASTYTTMSSTAFMRVKVTDNTATLVDAYIQGPNSDGLSLTKGYLYDMGTIPEAFRRILSSEQVQLEYVATGSPTDITGLTAVVVYKKVS